MDILLISNEDTCRSRIAQELLHAFGRGNEYLYGRNYGGELRSRCRVQCDGTEWFQRVSQRNRLVSGPIRTGRGTT